MARATIADLTPADIAFFFASLKRTETGCLEWIGGNMHPQGYGMMHVGHGRGGRTKLLTHRVAFVLAGGVLTPEKPHVLHACDNKPCCEPTHLLAGTNAENRLDMAAKGRGRKSLSGLPRGVQRTRNGKRFIAHTHDRARAMIYLGTFDSAEEAEAVASAAHARFMNGFTGFHP